MIENPISVYINWAAYDELSDNVELTEAIAMEQLVMRYCINLSLLRYPHA